MKWRQIYCDTWDQGYRAFEIESPLCHLLYVGIDYWKTKNSFGWYVAMDLKTVYHGRTRTKKAAKRKAIAAYNKLLRKAMM